GLLAFLFSSGWTIHYQPGTPVDLFEDGQPLANAATYLQGGHPYLQTYPVHGWGADGGLDSLFFRVFGPSLQTFRVRRAIVTALALTALGLCSFSLFENLRWAAVALAACLCFCPFVSERQTLALLALALLLRAARRESRLLWLVAGMVSGAALFFSLDFGLIALSAGLCSGLALSVLWKEREQRPNLQPVFRFVSGILLGAVPFLALLAGEGALRAFFRISFCEIPALVSETWGLPAGSATRIARETPLWRFP